MDCVESVVFADDWKREKERQEEWYLSVFGRRVSMLMRRQKGFSVRQRRIAGGRLSSSVERQTENGDERRTRTRWREQGRDTKKNSQGARYSHTVHPIQRSLLARKISPTFSKLEFVSRICLSISCPGQVSDRKPEISQETRCARAPGRILDRKRRCSVEYR